MAEIELGAPYWVYQPDLTKYAKLNDPADLGFVGYVSDITGLDDAEVRESSQLNSAGDGGYNGPFWRGRRPWTISGFIMPTTPVSARSVAMRRLETIMWKCMRQDGYLMWQPSDGVRRLIPFRKQQPIRIGGGQASTQKTFVIAGVTADARISSATSQSISTFVSPWTLSTHSAGEVEASPFIQITGPVNAPVIQNITTGKKITFLSWPSGDLVPAGYTMNIYLNAQYPNAQRIDGYDFSAYINTLQSDWSIGVDQGVNNWQMTGSDMVSGQTGLMIQWNDAYV